MEDVEEMEAPPGDAAGAARATLVVKCAGKGQPIGGTPDPSLSTMEDALCVEGKGGVALLGRAVVDIGCETGVFLDGSVVGGPAAGYC